MDIDSDSPCVIDFVPSRTSAAGCVNSLATINTGKVTFNPLLDHDYTQPTGAIHNPFENSQRMQYRIIGSSVLHSTETCQFQDVKTQTSNSGSGEPRSSVFSSSVGIQCQKYNLQETLAKDSTVPNQVQFNFKNTWSSRKRQSRTAAMELLQKLHRKFVQSLSHRVSLNPSDNHSVTDAGGNSHNSFDMSAEDENVSLTANSIQSDMLNALKLTEYRPVSPSEDSCHLDKGTCVRTMSDSLLERHQSIGSSSSMIKQNLRVDSTARVEPLQNNQGKLTEPKVETVSALPFVKSTFDESGTQDEATLSQELMCTPGVSQNGSQVSQNDTQVRLTDGIDGSGYNVLNSSNLFLDAYKLLQNWLPEHCWPNEAANETEVQNALFHNHSKDVVNMLSDKSLYVWQIIESI